MSIKRLMDKEDVVSVYNGILAICKDVDETRQYYAKQNKSIRERQLSYDLPDMRKWRCNMGG